MESDLKVENLIARLKEYLNAHKIKLWLEPYFDNVVGIGAKEEEALQVIINIFHHLGSCTRIGVHRPTFKKYCPRLPSENIQ